VLSEGGEVCQVGGLPAPQEGAVHPLLVQFLDQIPVCGPVSRLPLQDPASAPIRSR